MFKTEFNWRQALGISLGALLISTLGIAASDQLSGVSSRLSGTVFDATQICGPGETQLAFGPHSICMDLYEASPSSGDCVYQSPQSAIETLSNLAKPECKAVSEAGREPWRFVAYTEARQLCARSGKRLPTNEEWYKVTLGISDVGACFSRGNTLRVTGENECVTQTGVYDLAGNLWEWMDDTVTDGYYEGRDLPLSGYVALVDERGVVLETSEEANLAFGEDYAWVEKEGTRGILRGGFYGSGSDGGIFAQNLAAPLDFAAAGVGFRCVRDVW